MREAAKQYSWKLNYGSIALMWRGGCIIRRFDLIEYFHLFYNDKFHFDQLKDKLKKNYYRIYKTFYEYYF